MSTTVTTQAELDAALAVKAEVIYIQSDAGVTLHISNSGSSRVVAWGSSRVVAWGSSHVEAWGSSHVVARDSSRVVARDSSRVVAWGSSRVEAWGSSRVVARDSSRVEARGSSHVEARDSSRVEAWGSSRVVARGSSHVEAWGSSHVEARDSSRVVARDSSRVVARDSSHVEARDSSHVEASPYVAVHLHSARVDLTGGVVIDLTKLDLNDTQQWLDFHGAKVADGQATVYKAVDADLFAGQGYTLTAYPIEETVTAPDWRADQECGHGLHFAPSPSGARRYFNGAGKARFLECLVPLDAFVALGDKCKARSCAVVREVDIYGEPVPGAVEVTP